MASTAEAAESADVAAGADQGASGSATGRDVSAGVAGAGVAGAAAGTERAASAAASERDFVHRADPFRAELLAHCYRMLGSIHDAEDLVQETYLRAWRAFDRYDPERASIRTWLYRIATNVCLTALEGRGRRPLPSGFVGRSDEPRGQLHHGGEVTWLQPMPDALLATGGGDPAAALFSKGSMRLAFLAAVQLLPARQRATLILREVLDFSAIETADILDTTTAAVNSALQRARARLGDAARLGEPLDEPELPEQRALIERYVEAFEKADIDGLKRLLADDVLMEMPPMLNWYVGVDDYIAFLEDKVFSVPGTTARMVWTAANGQLTLMLYMGRDGGVPQRHTLQVFTVGRNGISRLTVFQEPEIFDAFGLPETLPG